MARLHGARYTLVPKAAMRRMTKDIGGATVDGVLNTPNGPDAARERLVEIETLVAKLLDAMSATTRDASQRRIGQLEAERGTLRSELGALDRLALTEAEAAALLRENTTFLAGLEKAIRSGTVASHRAAQRTGSRDQPRGSQRGDPHLHRACRSQRYASREDGGVQGSDGVIHIASPLEPVVAVTGIRRA
jgi:hypothetical protein